LACKSGIVGGRHMSTATCLYVLFLYYFL
jgi:hypothetical protein